MSPIVSFSGSFSINQFLSISFESVESEVSSTSERKPPIILLHGMTYSKETWKNFLHPLASETGRKIYAFDARNHGDSGWSDEMSYPIMMEDLLIFMNSLNAERAILIGHSMGGRVAMYFALKWPDRVEKLILEDISPKISLPRDVSASLKYVQLLHFALEKIPKNVKDLATAKNFLHKFMKEIISKVEVKEISKSDDDGSALPLIQDENGRFRWKTNLKVIEERYLKDIPDSTFVKGLYPDPALFIWGTKSPFTVIADKGFILEQFPKASFRAVEGAKHTIHEDFKEVFLKEVIQFINETTSLQWQL